MSYGNDAIKRLRERQAERAKVQYWKPSPEDDFRLIVWRRQGTMPSSRGELPIIEGYDVVTGDEFRMPFHNHLRWQFETLGFPEGPPAGAILSVLWTGMGRTREGNDAYSYSLDVLTEVDVPEELQTQVAELVRRAREEAQAAADEQKTTGKGAGRR